MVRSKVNRLLPVGKLPPDLLARLLALAPTQDPKLILGPGVGLDCAVIEMGDALLVLKTDPITFATDEIGWYAVQVSANDIATTGASPRWFLAALLLPEKQTTSELVERIGQGLFSACREIGVSLVGGHTEITYDLKRPILVGTMLGIVSRNELITPLGAQPGDRILLTKGVPIEATAILAREFADRLQSRNQEDRDQEPLTEAELVQAGAFLHHPGIGVLKDARIAIQAGSVHAMHDPTEGGLYTALWELAEASGCSLRVNLSSSLVFPLSVRICHILNIDPFGAIASGALLLTSPSDEANTICSALQAENIPCFDIGEVLERVSPPQVWQSIPGEIQLLPRPERDEIAKLFEG